jgi:hypothetical protein
MKYIAIHYNDQPYGTGSTFHGKLWCKNCCDKFQLYWIPKDQPLDNIVTLEDVVREIIREEINATR